jgi:uncharacterized membrane protein YhaH (DUF805 family)
MYSFMEAVKRGFSNYVVFDGRAVRSEYWWWTLFAMVGTAVAGAIDGAVTDGLLGAVFGLAILLPGLSVSVRRLHDGDRSGWWLLIVFVPIIGALLLLVWFAQRGTAGQNRFGADPLGQQFQPAFQTAGQ